MRRYQLELIVFICGAVVMILEMVGSRILAPVLGTSLIVWTGIIGVILASLSIGYAWGGKLADKNPTYRQLSQIIYFSAVSVLVLTLLQLPILAIFSSSGLNLYWQTIFSTIVLFAPASILLGMISPYAVRLKMKDVNTSGRLVGNLYAVSTVGSIVGTFLTGFVLLAFLNHTVILLGMVVILSILSLVTDHRSWLWIKILLFIVVGLSFAFNQILVRLLADSGSWDISTSYNRVLVQDITLGDNHRPVRIFRTDNHAAQSMIYRDSTPTELAVEYAKYYDLARYFNPHLSSALVIGGAAYVYPRHFLDKFASTSVDVVEIDPDTTKIARQYFGLADDPRLGIIYADGRVYLNGNKKLYDSIFVDAFQSGCTVPFHLTTVESMKGAYRSLNGGGVLVMNIIASLNGEGDKFFRAEYRTLKEVFPQVYVFKVDDAPDDQGQNIILLAIKSDNQFDLKSDDPEIARLLSRVYTKDILIDLPVLTDSFAPIDRYMAQLSLPKI